MNVKQNEVDRLKSLRTRSSAYVGKLVASRRPTGDINLAE